MRALGYDTKDNVCEGLSHYNYAPGMARAFIRSGWLIPLHKVFNQLRRHYVYTIGG